MTIWIEEARLVVWTNFTFLHRRPEYRIGNEITKYYSPLVFILGMVGNILSFTVYARRKQREKPLSIYMRSLAVADSCELVFYFVDWLNFRYRCFQNHSVRIRNILKCWLVLWLFLSVRFLKICFKFLTELVENTETNQHLLCTSGKNALNHYQTPDSACICYSLNDAKVQHTCSTFSSVSPSTFW